MEFNFNQKPIRTGKILASAAVLAMATPAIAQVQADANVSVTADASADANATKSIYTGVVTGVNNKTVDGNRHVLVTLESGSDREMQVDLGELSKERRNKVMLDARMDVIAEQNSDGVWTAKRANVNGKALVGNGIGADEIERNVASGEKNFTGLINRVAKDSNETTFSLTSGVGKTVQTTIDKSRLAKSEAEMLKEGTRASITGDVESGNRVDAERVIVAGGAKASNMSDKADEKMGAMSDSADKAKQTVASGEKNFTGMVDRVSSDGEEKTFGLTSGAGKTVQTTIDKSRLTKKEAELLKEGSRTSITGDVESGNRVDAERVIVAGGAKAADMGNMAREKMDQMSESAGNAARKSYTGVITGTESITVDGKTHVVAVMKSDSGSIVRADLGNLSTSQKNKLTTGSKIDISGRVDGSGMMVPQEVKLQGEAFLTAN